MASDCRIRTPVILRRTIRAVLARLHGNQAKCPGNAGFFRRVAESLDLHRPCSESILLQRGMTDLPFVMPPALPGRFLPELGRSLWSGLFFRSGALRTRRATARSWRRISCRTPSSSYPPPHGSSAAYSAASRRWGASAAGSSATSRVSASVSLAWTSSKCGPLAMRSSSKYSARLISTCSACTSRSRRPCR